MRIAVVSYDYPDEKRSVFPFVKQLVEEWVRQGHECFVIAPYSITSNKRFHKRVSMEPILGGNRVTVIRPNYISVSNVSFKGKSVTNAFHERAVEHALQELPIKPDVVYCHFWNMGIAGVKFAQKKGIKCFVASGESKIPCIIKEDADLLRENVAGVICVSTKNRDESVERGLTTPDKCAIFPNSVNTELFHKMDKAECRQQLNIPQDAFVITYVGWFDDRKGVKRVEAALRAITTGKAVHSIFIGSGRLVPTVDGILFKGSLPHEAIPTYLNAADVFVLPTLREGCCNAVIEAMACGLPIISSNLPFNGDVLDESISIMVDPMNIEQIKEAIIRLRDDEQLRCELSEGALKRATTLAINQRAKKIIYFIQSKQQ